jgi:hypothetical protein
VKPDSPPNTQQSGTPSGHRGFPPPPPRDPKIGLDSGSSKRQKDSADDDESDSESSVDPRSQPLICSRFNGQIHVKPRFGSRSGPTARSALCGPVTHQVHRRVGGISHYHHNYLAKRVVRGLKRRPNDYKIELEEGHRQQMIYVMVPYGSNRLKNWRLPRIIYSRT